MADARLLKSLRKTEKELVRAYVLLGKKRCEADEARRAVDLAYDIWSNAQYEWRKARTVSHEHKPRA